MTLEAMAQVEEPNLGVEEWPQRRSLFCAATCRGGRRNLGTVTAACVAAAGHEVVAAIPMPRSSRARTKARRRFSDQALSFDIVSARTSSVDGAPHAKPSMVVLHASDLFERDSRPARDRWRLFEQLPTCPQPTGQFTRCRILRVSQGSHARLRCCLGAAACRTWRPPAERRRPGGSARANPCTSSSLQAWRARA